MEYRLTDSISEKDKSDIYNGLLSYNIARLEDKSPRGLGIFLEDDNGDKLAGLIAETHGNWLTVKYLWVAEKLRGQNIGSTLLNKAEETAKERGCKFVFLDTFGFQAPDFYRKHGYKEVFVLENYPVSGKRYYFTKELV